MTLRLRLALGAAILAALSSLSVALIGYLSTQQRVNSEVQQSLTSALQRFQDPDGRLVDALCKRGPALGDQADEVDAGLLGGSPGVTLECRGPNGRIHGAVGPAVTAEPGACDLPQPGVIEAPRKVGMEGGSYAAASLRVPTGDCIIGVRSLTETHSALTSIRNRSVAVGMIVTLIAALGGLLAARRATKPIQHLTETAERIAATKDLEVALPSTGTDEVGRLATAFWTMLDALRQSQQQQQQLVQDAGHELRTPLTSIRTNVDTLERYPDLTEGMRKKILTDVHKEIEEMSLLVNELVVLNDDAESSGPVEEVDLSAVVANVVELWEGRSGRTIHLTCEGRESSVWGHQPDLARAVGNLIANAIKFSPPDTAVEVTVCNGIVEVRDHGQGVDEDDIDQLFDRFYRSVEARSLPGSGLGLAIVAQIVQRHGGSVSAGNHGDGGAIFRMDLSSAII